MLHTNPIITETDILQRASFNVIHAAFWYKGRLFKTNCQLISVHLVLINKKTPAPVQRQKLFRDSTLFTGKSGISSFSVQTYRYNITVATAGVYLF
jgi:hypothetical protein